MAFPGIESSSYSYLAVGQPLSIYGGYQYADVNSETGVYEFNSQSGKPTSSPTYPNDYNNNLGNTDPKFNGGFSNIMNPIQ